MQLFGNTLYSNGLRNLGFSGYHFTWHRGDPRVGGVPERLDCFCALQSWQHLFPDLHIWHLSFYTSDHSPILLEGSMHPSPSISRTLQYFERWWLEEQEIFNQVRNFWQLNMVSSGI